MAKSSAARPGWGAYLLRCADGSLYAGATNDLHRRLATHNAGKGARYTRSRLPVAVVYWRPARNVSFALKAEAALKRLTRAQKLTLISRARLKSVRPSRQPGQVRPVGLPRKRP